MYVKNNFDIRTDGVTLRPQSFRLMNLSKQQTREVTPAKSAYLSNAINAMARCLANSKHRKS